MIELRQDMHVHSSFSDGRDTIEDNVAEAERIGLVELTCVEHVRAGTTWVPTYVAAVRRVRETTPVVLHCAVETKLLDTAGTLDLPPDLEGVDAIYVADHQVPLADGPHTPDEVREWIGKGTLSASCAVEAIVASTAQALQRQRDVVIAHLFSVLPKLGLREEDVPLDAIEHLAAVTAETGARIEISEHWRCPSARTLQPFLRRGVPLLLSTDSHRRGTIGRYRYSLGVIDELTGAGAPLPG